MLSGLLSQARHCVIGCLALGLSLGLTSHGVGQPTSAPAVAPAPAGGGVSTPAALPAGRATGVPAAAPAGTSGRTPAPGSSVSPLLPSSGAPGQPASAPVAPGTVVPGAGRPASQPPGVPFGGTSPAVPPRSTPTPPAPGVVPTVPRTQAAPGVLRPDGTPVDATGRPPATPPAGPSGSGESPATATGDTGTTSAGKTQFLEELSPIERLLAGSAIDPSTPLRQFGYDLFARTPTTFAPITDVPISQDYIVGPGDSVNIVLWGGVQEAYQVTIERNGTLTLPRLGVVAVGGLTLDQLQNLLQRRFAEYYADFRMAVTLGKLRTILVYVVGEVQQPGAYTVSSLSTLVNALFASGGPTKNGSLRRIQVTHQNKKVHTIDLYNFLLQGDKSQDETLQMGDTIFVPLIGPVAGVAGNVKRPAIYEIEPGITLRRLFDLAGGITPLGYLQRVQVERVVANEKRIVVDFDLSAQQKARRDPWQTPIVEGDSVRVLSIIPTLENIVTLDGHVLRPGRYELKPGMRLRDLLPSYQALRPEAYPDYAELVRYVEPNLQRTIVPFTLHALFAGDPAANLVLQPQDGVRIFAKTDFTDPPVVTIEGEVRQPGSYPLLGGMRVADLIAKAGGVTNVAYLERAEILRVTATRDLQALPFHLEGAIRDSRLDNLLLHNEDKVVVHNLSEYKFPQQVQVLGLVHRPGSYALTRDMRVSDLIFRAGGVQKLAYLEKAELTRHRITQTGDTAIRLEISLSQALAGETNDNIFLEDFDQLLIRPIPNIELERVVEVLGEVRFPGGYPVQKGEHLASVLRRAGGFTDSAYLHGATFTRVRTKQDQARRVEDLIREEESALLSQNAAEIQATLSADDAREQKQVADFRRDMLRRLSAVQPDGRIVVRLRPLEALAGTVEDLVLEPGDQLTIPSTPQYVNVLGEVYNRTSLLYEPAKTIAYYLSKVGGLKKTAEEEGIFLVQANGTVMSNTQNQFAVLLTSGKTLKFKDFYAVHVQPGDSIIVPRRVVTPSTLRTTRDIVQIISQGISSLGVIAAILVSL